MSGTVCASSTALATAYFTSMGRFHHSWACQAAQAVVSVIQPACADAAAPGQRLRPSPTCTSGSLARCCPHAGVWGMAVMPLFETLLRLGCPTGCTAFRSGKSRVKDLLWYAGRSYGPPTKLRLQSYELYRSYMRKVQSGWLCAEGMNRRQGVQGTCITGGR